MVKLVRLKNVKLVIKGCVECYDLESKYEDARALIKVSDWAYKPVEIGDKKVGSYEEIPDVLENVELRITLSDAKIIVYDPKRREISIGFTDDEYAYMPSVTLDEIRLLMGG